jgi:transposase
VIIEPFIHFTCANCLLSRSTWLITSLSPGGREKMSKHGMPAGNVGALLARFAELRRKALARTGVSFPIVAIQEAGLDGFWIHCVLQGEGAYPAYGANGVK